MTVTDRGENVGKIKLKMQSLINGGNPQSLEGLNQLRLIARLEKENINWYPLFNDDNQCPGSLLIQSKFIPDEMWKEKILAESKKGKSCLKFWC